MRFIVNPYNADNETRDDCEFVCECFAEKDVCKDKGIQVSNLLIYGIFD